KILRMSGWVTFIRAEFIKVVIGNYIAVGRQVLTGGESPLICSRGDFGKLFLPPRSWSATGHIGRRSRTQAIPCSGLQQRRHSSCCQTETRKPQSADELTALPIDALRGYL